MTTTRPGRTVTTSREVLQRAAAVRSRINGHSVAEHGTNHATPRTSNALQRRSHRGLPCAWPAYGRCNFIKLYVCRIVRGRVQNCAARFATRRHVPRHASPTHLHVLSKLFHRLLQACDDFVCVALDTSERRSSGVQLYLASTAVSLEPKIHSSSRPLGLVRRRSIFSVCLCSRAAADSIRKPTWDNCNAARSFRAMPSQHLWRCRLASRAYLLATCM